MEQPSITLIINIQSVAQVVLSLLNVGDIEEDVLLAGKINYIGWTRPWVNYLFSYYNCFVME